MPRDEIDHSPLTVDRERHFRLYHPRRQRPKAPGHRLVESGVAGIEEPIQIAGPPPGDELEPDIDRGKDPPKGVRRDRTEMTPFDPGDG
jgi:hypothetical protein